MSLPVILFGLFVILYALHYYITRTFNHWKRKNVKGPKPSILFGNIKDFTLRRELFTTAVKRVYDEFPDEPYVGMYRLTNPALVIRDLDLIKIMLIKDFDTFDERGPYSATGLGRNLFHADSETWRVLRSRFTPLFTSAKIRNMLHLMTEQGDIFVNYVQNVTFTEPEQPVHKLIQLFTVANISACAFGLDIKIVDKSDPTLARLEKLDRLLFVRSFWYYFNVVYPGVCKFLNVPLCPPIISEFFRDLVSNVTEERKVMPSSRNDFMDLLLKLKNEGHITGARKPGDPELSLEITDEIIAAQASIFYAAGYETSATTMSFMLYELAKNPLIQEKLCKEVDEVLEASNNVITYDTLSQLPYMEKVFDETLRMYPFGPLQRHVTKEEYTIPGTDLVLEKGTTVLVSVFGIHHDKKLYPNPKEFEPDRFDPQVAEKRHPCAYLPFGVGPRNCIGMRFAKVMSRVCILKLLSRFNVELVPSEKEMTFDANRTLISPNENYKLKFVPRKKNN